MKLSRLVVFTVALIAASSTAFAQGDTANPPKPAGGVPTFNFNLRTLESDPVLPFDQIFNVRAKVDADVQNGKLQVRPKTDQDCAFVDTDKFIAGRRVTRAENDIELVFSAPMVLPNVDYCFVFRIERKISDTQANAFTAKARELIDKTTFSGGLRDVENNERKNLRDTIALEMQKLGDEQKSVIEPGSPFGANPTRESRQTFNTLFQEITQANGTRQLGAQNYCNRAGLALKAIENALVVGAPARTLLDAVAAARRNPDNRALTALVDTAMAGTLDAIAKAEYEKVLKVDCATIVAMTDPEQATAVRGDLDRIRAQFKAAERLMTTLAADEAAAQTVNISTKEQKRDATAAAKAFQDAAASIGNADSGMRNFEEALKDREAALDNAAEEVRRIVVEDVNVVATSIPDFVTRHGFYVTMDVGVASAWDIDEVFSYVGMNFYTRPINKAVPLKRGETDWFRKRFSATLGLTLQTLIKNGAYKGVLSDRGLVGAVGWRVLDSVKLTAGGILLKENDRNPLVDQTHLAVTPFVAVSIDWDVRNTLKGLGSAFGVP